MYPLDKIVFLGRCRIELTVKFSSLLNNVRMIHSTSVGKIDYEKGFLSLPILIFILIARCRIDDTNSWTKLTKSGRNCYENENGRKCQSR